MVTLTDEEWSTLGDPEQGGSPAKQKAHLANEEMTVFGRTVTNEPAYKKVNGVPQELGVGAPGRESVNHLAAILKYEGMDAYQAACADIWRRDPARAEKLNLPKRRGAS
jgi:hypothetical protein